MKLPKIIIFDVGGTLLKGDFDDSILGYTYLYEEVLDVKETLNDYLDFVKGMFHVIKQRESCDLEFNFRSFFNYLKDLYGLKTDKSYEKIEYLKNKNIPLYVLSNSMYSTNLIEKELEEVGIKDYFIQIISSGDHLVRKPSYDLFKLYLKKFSMMGYKYSEICYIGNDYYYDVETPVKLGMMSIHLSDKFMIHEKYLEVDSYLKLIEEFKKYE